MAHAYSEPRGWPLQAGRCRSRLVFVVLAALVVGVLLGRSVRAAPSAEAPASAPSTEAPSAVETREAKPSEAEPSKTEPSEADREAARALAAEGYAALRQNRFDVAADRFQRADALAHSPTLVVDHARALVGLGRLAEAYERYALVLREGVAPDAPWPWKRAVTDAGNEIQIVESRLAWLSVNVEGVVEPRVTLNGAPLAPANFGAEQPVNPGLLVVRAFAVGYAAKEQSLILAEGEHRKLVFELLREPKAPRPVAAAPRPAPEPTAPPAPPPAPPPPEDRLRKTLTYTAFGVGAAGIVIGGVAGVLALDQRGTLADECTEDGVCASRSAKRISRYHTLGTLSGIGLLLGLGGMGAGLALTWTEPARGHRERARVVPYVGAAEAGLTGVF